MVLVFFLFVRDEDENRFLGFGFGVDDYMIKFFFFRELILRFSIIFRRIYFLLVLELKGKLIFNLGSVFVDMNSGIVKK